MDSFTDVRDILERLPIQAKRARFGIIPAFAIHNYGKHIGTTAVAIYALLCVYANNETNIAYPSYTTIGEKLGISKRSVTRNMKVLEKHGLISKESGGNGKGDTVKWYIMDRKGTQNEIWKG